eukprot:m.223598 g.223598  ORF g.223598 m.223598 type:complete len:99 (-) comp17272_c1_seq24:909-1205(-)
MLPNPTPTPSTNPQTINYDDLSLGPTPPDCGVGSCCVLVRVVLYSVKLHVWVVLTTSPSVLLRWYCFHVLSGVTVVKVNCNTHMSLAWLQTRVKEKMT